MGVGVAGWHGSTCSYFERGKLALSAGVAGWHGLVIGASAITQWNPSEFCCK